MSKEINKFTFRGKFNVNLSRKGIPQVTWNHVSEWLESGLLRRAGGFPSYAGEKLASKQRVPRRWCPHYSVWSMSVWSGFHGGHASAVRHKKRRTKIRLMEFLLLSHASVFHRPSSVVFHSSISESVRDRFFDERKNRRTATSKWYSGNFIFRENLSGRFFSEKCFRSEAHCQ